MKASVLRQEVEVLGDEPLPDRTEGDPEDGDRDLDGGDEPHRIVHEAQRGARGPAAVLGPLLEPPAARGHQRVLSRYEDCIAEYEQQHRPDAKRVAHAPLRGALVLGGSSPSTSPGIIGDHATAARSHRRCGDSTGTCYHSVPDDG